MLQQIDERPVLLGNALNSYGMGEHLVIQPSIVPTGPMTFDWSDFPFVLRNECFMGAGTSANEEDLKVPLHVDISACSSDSDLSTTSSDASCKTHRRKVSFSDKMHVRTHSIVLGDHPCCSQLALELGWEHDDGSFIEMQKDTHKRLRRRSYFERKALLKEVGGLTDDEIRKTTLRQAAPSSRDLSAMQGISL